MSSSVLPRNHSQRIELNDEVHARPPETLSGPLGLTYVVLLSDWANRDAERARVEALADRFGGPPVPPGVNHYSADLGIFRVKWERHTEFARYKFIHPASDAAPFSTPVAHGVPADWLATLPGEVVVAMHVSLIPASREPIDFDEIAARHFHGNALVGSAIGEGVGVALTDFRVHPDGFSRLLVLDHGMSPRQAGRMVQRLLEMETYRIMALLAFPVARHLAPVLTAQEGELAQITAALTAASEADEAGLLDRLTRLEAAIERGESDTHYRFGASAAYYDLVRGRIAELREARIEGLQNFEEFTERRLAPAMATCQAVARRQESLSERVARATQLLSTRVDITRERQNQAVLESMNRRAKLQLRLQQTVEGLSVAAVTYYVVGLVGYLAKSVQAAGIPIDPDIAMGVAVPVVILVASYGMHRIRRRVARGGD